MAEILQKHFCMIWKQKILKKHLLIFFLFKWSLNSILQIQLHLGPDPIGPRTGGKHLLPTSALQKGCKALVLMVVSLDELVAVLVLLLLQGPGTLALVCNSGSFSIPFHYNSNSSGRIFDQGCCFFSSLFPNFVFVAWWIELYMEGESATGNCWVLLRVKVDTLFGNRVCSF